MAALAFGHQPSGLARLLEPVALDRAPSEDGDVADRRLAVDGQPTRLLAVLARLVRSVVRHTSGGAQVVDVVFDNLTAPRAESSAIAIATPVAPAILRPGLQQGFGTDLYDGAVLEGQIELDAVIHLRPRDERRLVCHVDRPHGGSSVAMRTVELPVEVQALSGAVLMQLEMARIGVGPEGRPDEEQRSCRAIGTG